MEQTIFTRTELLLGTDALERLSRRNVIIFGVGGVGSWCAEALVRTGIRQLTIVDGDRVSITNVNRQLMATMSTVGRVKVEALKERLLDINPDAQITALFQTFSETAADEFHLGNYDVVIDAIDSLKDKAALIIKTCELPHTRLFSSMGAALKADPTRILVAEFWKVQGDPLARALRRRFKRDGRFPARKFQCVYSDELLRNQGNPLVGDEESSAIQKQPNGSLVHITAIFGLTLASQAIHYLISTP